MKELVIVSGKGGTGKTSTVASLASLAPNAVFADCDVDASDLHLILSPDILEEHEFIGGSLATINYDNCKYCGRCREVCKFDAISEDIIIDPVACEGCNVCAYFCPTETITMKNKVEGRWFKSNTRNGMMYHAKLNIAEDNSGKLVTVVKKNAKEYAKENDIPLVIVDGPPGVGCPVISALTGGSLVLIVTEPTVSGVHDLGRVLDLAFHFGLRSTVCINKYDLNIEKVNEIESLCKSRNIEIVGRVPYDIDFTKAQNEMKSIVDYSDGAAAGELKAVWKRLSEILEIDENS